MSKEFFNLLAEQIDKSGFTSERLEYALNNLLNTFHYKQLTIADLMSIDVKCKVYGYTEMCGEIGRTGGNTDDYTPIWFGDSKKPYWVLRSDKERYRLPEKM